ncbi:MAG: beta-propeller fold lactonase family protein [Anaerolineae bacterium]
MVYRVLVAQQDDDRITVFRMDPSDGRLRVELEYALAGGPAPLALDPLQRWVVVGLRARPGLAVVRLDPVTVLASDPETIALPVDPCYVSTDSSGRYVLTAYYGSGRCAVHRVRADGVLDPQAVQWIETEPHAHCIRTDAENRFAYLPQTMPADRIQQFAFDAESGRLTLLAEPLAPVVPGEGPRHYTYHPTQPRVYFSNENGSSVSAYTRDGRLGQLAWLGTWSTLPDGYTGRSTCAQIHIDPEGHWLYVSNRGHDSLAIFAVDSVTGMLTPAGHRATEPTPRAFGIDPTGRFVYIASLGSNRLAAYHLVRSTGQLEEIATYPLGSNPMWVLPLSMADAS